MINIISRLSENNTEVIDPHKILSQKNILIIESISNEISKITCTENVNVYVNCNIKSFNFSIDSQNETIISLIQDIIDKYC